MTDISDKTEKDILVLMPHFTDMLRARKELPDAQLEAIYKLYPDVFDFAKNTTLEEIMEFNARYRDHKIYGEYFREFATQNGREYLEYILERAREFTPKQK